MPPRSSLSRPDDLLKVSTPRQQSPRTYGLIIQIIRPVLAFIILGIIIIVFTGPFQDDPLVIHETPTQKHSSKTSNDLIAPKFASTDQKGRPFTFTARRAVQSPDNPDLLILETPTGTMTLSSNIIITGGAPLGQYNQTTTELDLSGGVVLTTSDGYNATSDRLYLNAKKKIMTTDQPIQISGPKGSITAKGADGNLITGKLILKGPATLILIEGGF